MKGAFSSLKQRGSFGSTFIVVLMLKHMTPAVSLPCCDARFLIFTVVLCLPSNESVAEMKLDSFTVGAVAYLASALNATSILNSELVDVDGITFPLIRNSTWLVEKHIQLFSNFKQRILAPTSSNGS